MANNNGNFFDGLFDFTFTKFVTTKIISVIYIIGMVLGGIGAIGFAFSGFKTSTVAGVITLIFSPIFFLLFILYLRVILELIIVSFKTAENTRQTAENTRH
jgi:uncharacterized membrane protein